MLYKKELSKVIKQSKLSLREIAKRCDALGLTISHSYISQLQSGKLPPPKEEVTIMICKACNADPTDLILQGYIEKAPEIVQKYFQSCSNAVVEIYKALQKLKRDGALSIDIEEINKLSQLRYTLSDGWKFLVKVNNKENITQYAIKDNYEDSSINQFFMNDISMEPLIPKSAYITTKSYETIETMPDNGDIIVFEYIGKRDTYIRRFQKLNNIILLKPENSKFDTIQLNNIDDIIIYGKVVNYTASVN